RVALLVINIRGPLVDNNRSSICNCIATERVTPRSDTHCDGEGKCAVQQMVEVSSIDRGRLAAWSRPVPDRRWRARIFQDSALARVCQSGHRLLPRHHRLDLRPQKNDPGCGRAWVANGYKAHGAGHQLMSA